MVIFSDISNKSFRWIFITGILLVSDISSNILTSAESMNLSTSNVTSTPDVPTDRSPPARREPLPEQELLSYLFSDQRYDPDAHPVRNVSSPVHVTIDIMLNDIMELDTRTQLLEAVVWIRLYWADESLVWSPDDFHGIKEISLSARKVWRPDIVLYNMAKEKSHDFLDLYPVSVTHEGRIAWLFPSIAQASCDLDVTFFPWDNQTCELIYGSWTQDINSINLQPKRNHSDVRQYNTNGEYELTAYPVRPWLDHYDLAGKGPFTMVSFEFHLKRKPLYYVNSIVIPSVLVSVLAGVVFLVPPGGGEKISLSITVMLASTVFLLIVSDVTPIQSDYVPIMGNFFLWMTATLATTTMMSVAVVYMNDKGDSGWSVPRWMKCIILKGLAKCCCAREKAIELLQEEEDHSRMGVMYKYNSNYQYGNVPLSDAHMVQSDTELKLLAAKLEVILSHMQHHSAKMNGRELSQIKKAQWALIAMIIDRIFFGIFLVLFIGMLVYLLT